MKVGLARFLCLAGILGLFPLLTRAEVETLRGRDGEVMRGTPLVIGKGLPESVAFAENLETWRSIRDRGLNTVRLCWLDPWYRREGQGEWPHWSVEEALPHIDKCIENAATVGLNLILNYHDVGEFEKAGDFGVMAEFWTAAAKRYRDVDHVVFELNNEQSFQKDDYLKSEFKEELRAIYERVRKIAPKRQIILFSFYTLSVDWTEVVASYDWIDWEHTAVGFHAYAWPNSDLAIDEANFLKLTARYRTICTEWGYDALGFDYVKHLFGYEVNGRFLEERGLSWSDWRDWDDNSFTFLDTILLPDAQANGYGWKAPR